MSKRKLKELAQTLEAALERSDDVVVSQLLKEAISKIRQEIPRARGLK